MAKSAKTVVKESTTATTEKKEEIKVEKKEIPVGKSKIKMIRTYMGPAGTFYAGKVYELEGKILSDLLKNKDAIKC